TKTTSASATSATTMASPIHTVRRRMAIELPSFLRERRAFGARTGTMLRAKLREGHGAALAGRISPYILLRLLQDRGWPPGGCGLTLGSKVGRMRRTRTKEST